MVILSFSKSMVQDRRRLWYWGSAPELWEAWLHLHKETNKITFPVAINAQDNHPSHIWEINLVQDMFSDQGSLLIRKYILQYKQNRMQNYHVFLLNAELKGLLGLHRDTFYYYIGTLIGKKPQILYCWHKLWFIYLKKHE